MRTIRAGVFAVMASLVYTSTATAQMQWSNKGVVSVNGGVQTGSDTFRTATTYELYDEAGTLSSSQKIGSSGFFDVSAGYKVWRNLVLAVGYSRAESSGDAVINATVPDPLFFDQLRSVTATLSSAKHTENAIHISGVWMVPVTDKIEVGISAGPSVFMLKQDVPDSLSVSEPGPSVQSVGSSRVSKTTGGFNAGLDVTYLLTQKVGAGLLARYTWGSAKLGDSADSLTVGGFQLGGGLRLRF